MRHLPALDGLRAIAVLSVVAYHAGLPVPAGFVGVDVFFVISGYLITRLLADEIRDTGRIDFLHFYARRARRILPAAVLVVVATLVATAALLPARLPEVAQSGAAAAAFVANFHFESVTGGYWDASAEQMPLLHLWSLSVEEQFYLLWPLLLIAVRKAPLRWLAAVALASFALAEALMWFNPDAAFYQMPARAWELAIGGLVALRPMALPRWSAVAGLLIVMFACFVPLPHFPGIGALPAVVGAALLIAAIHNGASVRVLELRPVVYVGLISYSLYLWHWPLLALDRAMRVGESPLAVRLALCALAVVLAALSYRYVEQPFRRSRARSGRVVAVGVACVAVLSLTTFGLAATLPQPRKVPLPIRYCIPFDPVTFGHVVLPRCGLPGRHVVMAGDSYAGSWMPLASSLAKRERLQVVSFTMAGCAPIMGGTVLETPKETKSCLRHNADLVRYVEQNGAQTVILAGRWLTHFKVGNVEPELTELVRRIAPHVGRILVIGPSPEMRAYPDKCAGTICDVSRAEFDALAAESWRVMRELDAMPKVEVIDVAGWLCDANTCPMFRGGTALYSDPNHVTERTAQAFAEGYDAHSL